jgi:hypothetical protein
MAIKIIKRRHAPETRPPAELVADAPVAEAVPVQAPSMHLLDAGLQFTEVRCRTGASTSLGSGASIAVTR